MSREYCDYIADQLENWTSVSVKRMFGGFGLYKQGQVFAFVFDDILYFKVDDSNRSEYENSATSAPFTYIARGKENALSYWSVPIDVLEDTDLLAVWAEKAFQAGLNASQKKKKKSNTASVSVPF